MNTKPIKDRLLASTIIAGVMIAAPAMAQNDPGMGATPAEPVVGGSSSNAVPGNTTGVDASGDTGGRDIVVTGSRIANPNLTSTSPLTVVGAQEVKLQGTTRVEDLINSLPQAFAAQGSSDANGASGIATVNLRNLGESRTLVLINGKRLVPGDPTSPFADLNFIPASLVQRIDVLTGGASSVYGADAVAGVVNFILDKDFTGVRLDAQYSFYMHDNRTNDVVRNALAARNFSAPDGDTVDGFQKNVTLTVGASTDDGRGHVTAYAGWRQVDALTQGDRDYSFCGLTFSATGASCGGSSTAALGRFNRTELVGFAAGQPVYAPTGSSFTLDPNAPGGQGFRPFVSARDQYNFNPVNFFQRPDERFTLGAFADYEVSEGFKPYLEVMFMDDRTKAQIAASGAFYGGDFFINCNNPLMTAAQQAQVCGASAGTSTLQSVYLGRRNVEGGGRVDDLRHTAYRIVAGTKGDIAPGISYDAYGQFGRTIFSERYLNDFSNTRLNRALNAVTGPDGRPTCVAALPDANNFVADANCVPYNIFQVGGVTQDQLTYLQTPGFKSGQTTEYVASASISASLGEYGVQSPWSDQGIGIAIGTEYRKEALELYNDTAFLTGDLAGQGTPFGVNDAKGSFDVKELFGEIQIPIVSDKPFFELLSFEAGYRYSKYSTAGTTDTYKLAAEWSPVSDLRFRAAYNRAVRAPNIVELFTPATVGLFPSNGDPCSGALNPDGTVDSDGNVDPSTFAQCAPSGVTAGQFGNIDPSPAFQYNQRTSGNPNLSPETADTYTVGVVLTPRFLSNFTLSVDAFKIKVKDLIGSFGADFTLSQCVQTGDPLFCSRINRAAGSGSLWVGNSFVDNPTTNLGSSMTQGIDVNASYRYNTDTMGSFGFDMFGTYLDKFETTPLPGDLSVGTYDCAGLFGADCGTPLPRWRHRLRVTWNTPWDIQLSGAWRFFRHVKNDDESNNPLIGGGPGTIAADDIDRSIPNVSFFDLALTTRFADKFTFRLGAQNLLDKQPPVRSSGFSNNGSNVYAQVYDSLGRYVYAGITIDF
jgi:iron complex outermembrane recepter protein